jgi:FlaA1/EpsC-like NDP-sugar epimerase
MMDSGRNRRTLILALLYAAVIGGSWYLAYEIRFDFIVPETHQEQRLRLLPSVIAVKLCALIAARQLGALMTYFSVPDLLRLFWAMSASSLMLFVPRLFLASTPLSTPRGVLLSDFMLCFGILCVGRLGLRLYRERLSGTRRPGGVQPQVQRIAIIGAGDAGASLAKEFLASPARGFRPVMFFDDDPTKHNKLVHGLPVVGPPESIVKLKEAGTLAKAVIAMPSAPAKRVREVVQLCTGQGLKVETLPSLEELTAGRVRVNRIRPVEVQDLLGREAVDLDSASIRQMIEGRIIMVTGAGGSIGSELCRQIAAMNPKRLLMVEQAEGSLFTIEQELNESGLGSFATALVADILDRERMEYIFSRYAPAVVFHAAAHKHVFMMERQPAEAIRNNVLGTRQLARIAAAHGVDAFVLISTDKAINPTSVMGATKRLAEIQLMALHSLAEAGGRRPEAGIPEFRSSGGSEEQMSGLRASGIPSSGIPASESGVRASEIPSADAESGLPASGLPAAGLRTSGLRTSEIPASGLPSSGLPEFRSVSLPLRRSDSPRLRPSGSRPTKFMAVRFGNVLGSSGSVIPIFKRQIANGGPVTVTHPEVTRYFMTIPEAVGLVLQSCVLGQGGEIFVLDMGQPVKIIDLARQMIELSGFKPGDDIEIRFTGLKPGEKLFEELQLLTEEYAPTAHPRITRLTSNATFSESGVIELETRLYEYDSNRLKELLRRLVPEYTPFLD